MAVVANLTPTAVPSNTTGGSQPMTLYHVKVTPAGGAGTYTINHGLPYTPTWGFAYADQAEGTTPALVTSLCTADFNGTVIAINVSANGTYHVVYG